MTVKDQACLGGCWRVCREKAEENVKGGSTLQHTLKTNGGEDNRCQILAQGAGHYSLGQDYPGWYHLCGLHSTCNPQKEPDRPEGPPATPKTGKPTQYSANHNLTWNK